MGEASWGDTFKQRSTEVTKSWIDLEWRPAWRKTGRARVVGVGSRVRWA
jgi:hypothetical protein